MVSITASPGVIVSVIVNPTADTASRGVTQAAVVSRNAEAASQSESSNGTTGGVIAAAVVSCFVAVFLVAIAALALTRKFHEDHRKVRFLSFVLALCIKTFWLLSFLLVLFMSLEERNYVTRRD